jgi:hypothetical protein
MTLYADMGDIRGVSDTHEQLGLINLAENRRHEALLYLEQALTTRRHLGNQPGIASSLRRLALAQLCLGHIPLAVCYFAQNLWIYWRRGVVSHQRLNATVRELVEWIVGQRRWMT